jgi:PPOX class probable F420-dependent enzyme
VNGPEWRERLAAARVAVLGTGAGRLVPVCFAVDEGGERAWSAVDSKPKRTTELARLDDVRATGTATLLVHQWDEDWDRLWWVRAGGPARVLDAHDAADGVARLRAKYPQYATHPLDAAVLEIDLRDWQGWSAS